MTQQKTWHDEHRESLSYSQRLADSVASGIGSWKFILLQTVFVLAWIGMNAVGFVYHWDIYPFILLNLLFRIEAAYIYPVIMMAQNRQNERDRMQAKANYQTNLEAKEEIEALQKKMNSIEVEKLDRIILMLEEAKINVKM